MKKFLFIFLFLLLISGILYFKYFSSAPRFTNQPISPQILIPKISLTTPSSTTSLTLPSRQWIMVAEEIVKKEKLPPPTAARLYAYTATTYYETLNITHDPEFASAATHGLLKRMYPTQHLEDDVTKIFKNTSNSVAYQYLYDTSSTLSIPLSTLSFLDHPHQAALDWLEKFFTRERADGFYETKKIIVPTAWQEVPLTTPEASTWQRWIIPPTTDLNLPSPPASGSQAYQDEITKLQTQISTRTTEDEENIQTWLSSGGLTMSGTWQDVLWTQFNQMSSSTPDADADQTYAYQQKILAQGLADTYNLVWQTKFTYWRARPNMLIPHFTTFISTPPTPSYVSEDASVTQVATTLLSTWFPEHRDTFLTTSHIIQESVVKSGIAFELDVREGKELGDKISQEILKSIH